MSSSRIDSFLELLRQGFPSYMLQCHLIGSMFGFFILIEAWHLPTCGVWLVPIWPRVLRTMWDLLFFWCLISWLCGRIHKIDKNKVHCLQFSFYVQCFSYILITNILFTIFFLPEHMPGSTLGFLHSKTCSGLKQKEVLNYGGRELHMMLTGSENILMHLRGRHLVFRSLRPHVLDQTHIKEHTSCTAAQGLDRIWVW